MERELNEAIKYFKGELVYRKLFHAFRKKYESLGRIGGTVSVKDFSEDELEELGKFFGLPGNQLSLRGSISLRAFEEQMERTRFSSLTLKTLLDGYFGEVIISKKEQKLAKEAKLHGFLSGMKEQFPRLASWIDHLHMQNKEGRWILQFAEKNPEIYERYLVTLDRAIQSLPQKVERLPMFSQRVTGDPHAFDLQTDLGRMLIHLFVFLQSEEDDQLIGKVPTSTEEINNVLERFHIYRDDLLNFVTCANLMAETLVGKHPVWEAAVSRRTVQIVPLRELIPLCGVKPAKGRVVWVVENSGVCATLLDFQPDVPIICTNGQFTLAAFMLMDLIVQEGFSLYYAGDFDPEGLGMAQRLLERYTNSVRLWRLDKKAYKKSTPTKKLPQERLEKLKRITHPDLTDVAKSMQEVGMAGYQEALVGWMIEDIRKGI